jgi:hypothetical protein
VNTPVSSYLSFCGHVVYASYEHGARIFGLTPLADQSAAGAEMWVLNSMAFVIPAIIIPCARLAPNFTRGCVAAICRRGPRSSLSFAPQGD